MNILMHNQILEPVALFLHGLSLPPRVSRVRTAFMRALTARIGELRESQTELVSLYATTDQAGMPLVGEDGTIEFKDLQAARAYHKELSVLMAETITLKLDPALRLDLLRDYLTGWEDNLSGDEADAYDALLTALEQANTNRGETVDD